MIVIIDDSETMRNELRNMLLHIGDEKIILFSSGDEYITKNKKEKLNPKLVFLDGTLLTGMNGFETLQQIKKEDPKQVVIMYGGFQVNELTKWMEAGATNFLSKRAKIEQVKHIVNKYYVQKHS